MGGCSLTLISLQHPIRRRVRGGISPHFPLGPLPHTRKKHQRRGEHTAWWGERQCCASRTISIVENIEDKNLARSRVARHRPASERRGHDADKKKNGRPGLSRPPTRVQGESGITGRSRFRKGYHLSCHWKMMANWPSSVLARRLLLVPVLMRLLEPVLSR